MNVGGETIQLSFGPASNAITSHLCNLQGLSCTSSSDPYETSTPSSPLCDPYITHSVQNDTYVPRVLFIDGKNCFNPWPDSNSKVAHMDKSAAAGSWGGNVQVHHRLPKAPYEYTTKHATSSTSANPAQDDDTTVQAPNIYLDRSHNSNWDKLNDTQQHALSTFQQTASVLTAGTGSSTSNSRYHSMKYKHVSSQFIYPERIASDDGRVMKWDDDDGGEEEEEEMDEYAMERKQMAERQRWNQKENEMQHQLTNAWDMFLGSGTNANTAKSNEQSNNDSDSNIQSDGNSNITVDAKMGNDRDTKIATAEQMRNHALAALQWMNYFMPPHPLNDMHTAPLPFERENRIHAEGLQKEKQVEQAMIYSYYAGKNPSASASSSFCSMNDMSSGMTREWREDVLSEKIRKWMEDCDSVRGFQIMVDADETFFGGVACSVLEELGDECRSAAKLSILVHDGDEFLDVGSGNGEVDGKEKEEDGRYWRSEHKAVGSFRGLLNSGLLLHGITENSDLVLPISMENCWQSLRKKKEKRNLFEASAAAALALETMTLPFRLARGSSKGRSKIGIGNGFFQGSSQGEDDMFPSVDKLSFHEFISSLKPSNRHIVTELSCLSHPVLPARVHQAILEGTSIERRQLEEEMHRNRNSRYRQSRGRDIDPGLWMEDEGPNGGILTSLSPVTNASSSRSLHDHFALATAFRPLPSRVGDTLATYTTSLMEGMAIRYRPKSTVATVVNQSFNELTGGKANSAGSYWSNIFGSQTPIMQPLCTLGNTTRMHDHLRISANGLKSALSRKNVGYMRRDGMAGLAPEGEDCEDAVEACLTLRDVYEPPSFGFDDCDDEGIYFEDNVE